MMPVDIPRPLTAREYKLLLDRAGFSNAPPEQLADAFWKRRLRPVIDETLGEEDEGKPRREGGFKTFESRTVRFFDTRHCILTKAAYCFRERLGTDDASGNSERELTLKLRLSDMFVAASTDIRGSRRNASTQFEEDISPLSIAVSGPISLRSRFSLSVKQNAARADIDKLGDIFELFPSLRGHLSCGDDGKLDPDDKLDHGPVIREIVFRGPRLRFGDGIVGKVVLTIWYFGRDGLAANVAEISFKCDIPGSMTLKAAQSAFDLFIGMQERLGDIVNRRDASKTELALPNSCKVLR
jgi:hypothetical protein